MSDQSLPQPSKSPELTDAARAFRERDYARAGALAGAVIAAQPDRADAWNLLALATEASGNAKEAAVVYERGIASTGSPILRNNFATLLTKQGDLTTAKSQLLEAVARDPGYAAAWSNLGSLLAAAGSTNEAERAFQSAIAADPANPLHPLDLAKTYLASGEIRLAERSVDQADAISVQAGKAMQAQFVPARANLALAMGLAQRQLGNRLEEVRHLLEAVELGAGVRARQHFVAALDGVEVIAPWPLLKSVLLSAFENNWGFTSELGIAATKQLLVEPGYRELLQLVETGKLEANNEAVARAASDALFLQVLERTVVTHPEFERLLTGLRRALLDACGAGRLTPRQILDLLSLSAALANQCFTTDHAWFVTHEEQAEVEKLTATVLEGIRSGTRPAPLALAVLGCYRALHDLGQSKELLAFAWPAPLKSLLERQLRAPLEEAGIKSEIRPVTPIRNAVSERARRQYEESPFPMWLEPPRAASHRDPLLWLKHNFPSVPAIELEAKRPLRVLVTGCGTGGEPTGLSLALADVTICAIDLSLSSLAYAIRKTRELAIKNIEYLQADLLELDSSIAPFDIVVSAGVLHHLENPTRGLQVLKDLTKPGGYLLIALYSEHARRHIVEAQAFAAKGGYDTSRDSMRRFRQDVYRLTDAIPWRADILGREDFYNLSMLRDLVFHVQEHRFTTETIEQSLDAAGLQFCGFTIGPETEQLFRMKFGAAADLLSLAQWGEFEADYPNTFSGMYHFLCRRPA